MNQLRKYLGIVWLLIGISLALFLLYKALTVLGSTAVHPEDYVFWLVIIAIFIPIIIGFILFGYYAFKGEYSKNTDSI